MCETRELSLAETTKSELSANFEEMIQARGLSPLIGQLLWQRNIRTAADLQKFLEPDLQGLHDPFCFMIWKSRR